jgi:hypothetical protein
MRVALGPALKARGPRSTARHKEARRELPEHLLQRILAARPTSRIYQDVGLRQVHARVEEVAKQQDFEVFRFG